MYKDSGSKKILLVEDDKVDQRAFIRTIQKITDTEITVCSSALEALDKLRTGKIIRPYIIVVDINMPKMDGHEFVDVLRKDGYLKKSVVFIFSTSDAQSDIEKAYDNNVSGYFVKKDKHSFLEIVKVIDGYTKNSCLPL